MRGTQDAQNQPTPVGSQPVRARCFALTKPQLRRHPKRPNFRATGTPHSRHPHRSLTTSSRFAPSPLTRPSVIQAAAATAAALRSRPSVNNAHGSRTSADFPAGAPTGVRSGGTLRRRHPAMPPAQRRRVGVPDGCDPVRALHANARRPFQPPRPRRVAVDLATAAPATPTFLLVDAPPDFLSAAASVCGHG